LRPGTNAHWSEDAGGAACHVVLMVTIVTSTRGFGRWSPRISPRGRGSGRRASRAPSMSRHTALGMDSEEQAAMHRQLLLAQPTDDTPPPPPPPPPPHLLPFRLAQDARGPRATTQPRKHCPRNQIVSSPPGWLDARVSLNTGDGNVVIDATSPGTGVGLLGTPLRSGAGHSGEPPGPARRCTARSSITSAATPRPRGSRTRASPVGGMRETSNLPTFLNGPIRAVTSPAAIVQGTRSRPGGHRTSR